MKRKMSKLQILRMAIQIACFLLLPGLFIDAFDGIKAITQAIVSDHADSAVLLPQIFPTVLLLLATLVLGRFFCGFMCAFGTLEDMFHLLGSKVFKIKFKMNETADKILKYAKFVLLLFIIVGIWIMGISSFSGWSPWDAFGMLDSFPPDFHYAFVSLTAGSIILTFTMIGSMFIERFFCRYFCPLGAVFSIVSRPKIGKVKKISDNCGKCRICTKNCAMGIDLYNYDMVTSGECINCMKCVSPCPRKNVKFTVAAKEATPLVAAATAVSVVGLYYAGNVGINAYASMADNTISQIGQNMHNNNSGGNIAQQSTQSTQQKEQQGQQPVQQPTQQQNQQSTEQSSQQPAKNTSGYVDGTYKGSGIGFKGRTTTVSVTISNGKISDIQTVSTGDDGRFYDRAFSPISSEIISNQSSYVDAVSGATFSSRGIMSAVADALSKAKR